MVNRVVLVGRLAQDPVLNKTASNYSVATFTLAVDNKRKRGESGNSTVFIRCQTWNALAENVVKFTKKGSLVGVDGRLISNSYTKKDGTKATSIEIVCDSVAFLGPKGQTNSTDEGLFGEVSSSDSNVETIDITEDDLPFN